MYARAQDSSIHPALHLYVVLDESYGFTRSRLDLSPPHLRMEISGPHQNLKIELGEGEGKKSPFLEAEE